MTRLFEGILFICALVVSFAALARHYAGANKQYSLKKSCYSLISVHIAAIRTLGREKFLIPLFDPLKCDF